MKYLAAYALLTLSGKKDISNSHVIQKQLTSSHSSEPSDPTSPMKTSIDALRVLRENPSTNSSPKDKRETDLVLVPHQPPQPVTIQSRRRKRIKNNKRKRKLLPHPPKKNKPTKISEISSDDSVQLFKINQKCQYLVKEYHKPI